MHEISIDIDSLEDLRAMSDYPKLKATLDSIRDDSSKGNTILIERRYSNAPSDLIIKLSNLKELDQWIEGRFPGFLEQ